MASITELTENELLQALRDAFGSQGETERLGMTVIELKSALGINDERVRKILRELITKGDVASRKIPHIAINGSRAWIPEYYLVKKD